MIPLVKLKYYNDLYEYDDIFSNKCYKDLNYDTKEKILKNNTYINQIKDFLCKNSNEKIIKHNDPNKMPLYKEYLNYATGPFVIICILFIIYCILFYIYYNKKYIEIQLLYLLFVYCAAFIIIYALLLKKITEIYNDTYIIEIYYSTKVVEEKEAEYKKTIIINSLDLSEEDKKNIKEKIKTVISFIYIYIIFIIILLYMLHKTLTSYYIYIIILILYVSTISSYYIYIALR